MSKIKKPSLDQLQQQIGELTEALQRERADAINARSRYEQQMSGSKQSARVQVVRDLLPAVDNLERALKHVPKDIAGHDYVKGISGVVKQFETIFRNLEVKRIKTVGQVFDPRYHEAISMEEGEGDKEIVSEELQSGYTMGEEVLRHAMVRVKPSK